MGWRPLSAAPGRETRVLFDSDGRIIIRTQQECDPVLERNKALRNSGNAQSAFARLVASIPMVIVHKWLQEGIDVFSGEQQDALARKLNDPDWAYLRTGGGRLGVTNGVVR